ncbi:hypothetical protein CDV55_105681 [Aspergillus turcosus]|uniref:Uncharacterized protein n=1 Tax=Aspergillus turcosus TaxID=1245748 RepID=A0A229XGA6_9EURO|nr:hypothetical protein CDV55_105681 [Aspergillus turcosus]RLL98502.1 hypothetical protein CFD26_105900 [Aspergillus turcosus]
MGPKLEPCCTMRGYMSKEHTVTLEGIKSGPSRIIVPITHGFIVGPGVKAEVLPGSGDWILLDPLTNVSHLNVRVQARTADGHSLYVHYNGVLKLDEAAGKVLSWAPEARTTNYGDHEWFSGPIFETSDPNLKWMETSLFVGQGHFVVEEKEEAVEYQIYKVVN